MALTSRRDILRVAVQWLLACNVLRELAGLLPAVSRQIFSALTIPENFVSCCQRLGRQSSPKPNEMIPYSFHYQELKRLYVLGGKRSHKGVLKVLVVEPNPSFKSQGCSVVWMHKGRREALFPPLLSWWVEESIDALRQELFLILMMLEPFPRCVSNV